MAPISGLWLRVFAILRLVMSNVTFISFHVMSQAQPIPGERVCSFIHLSWNSTTLSLSLSLNWRVWGQRGEGNLSFFTGGLFQKDSLALRRKAQKKTLWKERKKNALSHHDSWDLRGVIGVTLIVCLKVSLSFLLSFFSRHSSSLLRLRGKRKKEQVRISPFGFLAL